MDYKKIRQERVSFFILTMVSLTIVLISGIFILRMIGADDFYVVGVIASSAIMFFGLYSLITFIKRLSFVYFAEKVGNCIIYDKLRDVKLISEKFKVPQRKVEHGFKFLINNNYIEGYKLEGLKIVCFADERERQQRFIDAQIKQESEEKTSKKKTSARCDNCGANIVFEGEQIVCPYCGNLLKSKK